MKKTIPLILIVLGFLFFRATNALATSGACSDHDGVNCSAGFGSNGAVICNDGWTDSSVSFFSADGCENQSCTPDQLSALQVKYGIAGFKAQLNTLNQDILNLQLQYDEVPSNVVNEIVQGGGTPMENTVNEDVRAKQSQIENSIALDRDNYNLTEEQLESANESVNNDCQTLADNNYEQEMQESLAQQRASVQSTTPAPSVKVTQTPTLIITASTTLATTTSTSTSTQVIGSKHKHWYDWLNPINWF